MIGFGQNNEIQKNIKKEEVITISNFNNGNVKKEEVYRRGELIKIRYYHENGNLKKSKPYRNGSRHGLYLTYYKSGSLEYKGGFKNGQPVRTHYLYFETGEIKKIINYSRDGSEKGTPISTECYDKSNNLITCE